MIIVLNRIGLLFNRLIEDCTRQYIAYVYIEFDLPFIYCQIKCKGVFTCAIFLLTFLVNKKKQLTQKIYCQKKKDDKGVMNKTKAFVLSWLLRRNLLCTNRIV